MPSQNTQWSKDLALIEALDKMRQANLDFMSKCYFCGGMSVGIKAVQEKLYSVCQEHQEIE